MHLANTAWGACTAALDELVHKLDPVRKPGQASVLEQSAGFKELRRMRRVAIYPKFLHNKPSEFSLLFQACLPLYLTAL
jgi:hypothetical protein